VRKAVEEAFRKEFINRIDRIVSFRTLGKSTMRDILYKDLDLVLHRRGLRSRAWAVEWEDSAIDFLLDRGFDINLGARSLKRAIERYLLTPLALTIVNHQFPDGDQFLFVRSDGEKIVVEFIDPDAPDSDEEATRAGALVSAEEKMQQLSLGSIALDPRGMHDELEFLRLHYQRLESEVKADPWPSKKESYLAQMSTAESWGSSERFAVLGAAEYMDRIEAGLDTAGSLIRRLSALTRDSEKPLSKGLMRRLAQQVYLLREAYTGLEEGHPQDAFVLVRSGRDSGADCDSTDDFAVKLGKMYQHWATKRKMVLRILREEAGDSRRPYTLLMAVSGYASFSILEDEAGLHVLEVPDGGRQVQRVRVHVGVVAQPERPAAPGSRDLVRQALREFDKQRDRTTVVRNYRDRPSPLVRDAVRNWRTGRLTQVLEGDFDLLGR